MQGAAILVALFFCALFCCAPRVRVCVCARVLTCAHTNEIIIIIIIYIRNKEQRKEDKKQGRKETSKQERQKENKAKRKYNNTESKKREWKTQGKRKEREKQKKRAKWISIKARASRAQTFSAYFLRNQPTQKHYATQTKTRPRRALPQSGNVFS